MSDVKASKLLSLVLRHDPAQAGLVLGDGGWVPVDDLLTGLAAMGHPLSRSDIDRLVAESDKKRFSLSEDGVSIRAAQGHSVDVDLKLTPKEPPMTLYHGTAARFLDSILAEGLRPMSRRQVHLSSDVETAVKVGQRHGAPVVLRIDCRAMAARNAVFYQADNGVWLVDSVPPEYLVHHSES